MGMPQLHMMNSAEHSQHSLVGFPISLHGSCRTLHILSARRRKSRKDADHTDKASPARPPSLFIKQSPVPFRRPLRCVPFTNVLLPEENIYSRGVGDKNVGWSAGERKSEVIDLVPKTEDKPGSSSKWASLFEIASNQSPSKDSDAWFDKIFPKANNNNDKSEIISNEEVTPKLSAQQEKSIQQLQTLVKTLGVATRNTAPAPRRNKLNGSKLRQPNTPVQGGGVDPVPFSSILKKLQSASGGPHEQKLKELMPRQQIEDDELQLESEPETESESETDEEEEYSSSKSESENGKNGKKGDELAGLTVAALKNVAKQRGLSGYSKLKKDELIRLLTAN